MTDRVNRRPKHLLQLTECKRDPNQKRNMQETFQTAKEIRLQIKNGIAGTQGKENENEFRHSSQQNRISEKIKKHENHTDKLEFFSVSFIL